MNSAVSYLYAELPSISIALMTCLLVVFGADINQLMRKVMRGQHFVVRTSVFILLNAFGFGFLIIKVSPLLSGYLSQLPVYWLIGLLCLAFMLIGSWAQRNRHV